MLQVLQDGRAKLALCARGGPSDGFDAALDVPPEALLPDVADGVSAGLPPRTAAIRALDAWLKARRAAINSAARVVAAEHLAWRLRAAAEAVRRGHSMQDCMAVQPSVDPGDAVLSVVRRGGAVDVVAVDGAAVHTLSEPAERSVLADLGPPSVLCTSRQQVMRVTRFGP